MLFKYRILIISLLLTCDAIIAMERPVAVPDIRLASVIFQEKLQSREVCTSANRLHTSICVLLALKGITCEEYALVRDIASQSWQIVDRHAIGLAKKSAALTVALETAVVSIVALPKSE